MVHPLGTSSLCVLLFSDVGAMKRRSAASAPPARRSLAELDALLHLRAGAVAYTHAAARRRSRLRRVRRRAAGVAAPPPSAAPPFVPWEGHPLALLGRFKQYAPAKAEARIAPQPAGGLLATHEVHAYSDADAPDALNFGWCASLHVFELQPALRSALCGALAKAATRLAARGGGISVSNRGGWHSRRGLLRALAARGGRAGVAAALLRRAVAQAVAHADVEAAAEGLSARQAAALRAQVAARCAPDARTPPELSELEPRHAWANVSRPEAYNGLHDHEGALWSGVFYAQVPLACAGGASGALVLRTAVGGLTAKQAASAAQLDAAAPAVGWCRFAAVEPREGTLLLFPGWLPHAVLPLKGPAASMRISFSFNVGRIDAGAPDE